MRCPFTPNDRILAHAVADGQGEGGKGTGASPPFRRQARLPGRRWVGYTDSAMAGTASAQPSRLPGSAMPAMSRPPATTPLGRPDVRYRDARGFGARVVWGGGGLAAFVRALLWPVSLVYGAVVRLRGLAFRLGLAPRRRLPAPVIGVGNVTLGGTGKTPMVAWIVTRLREEGFRPAVLSRGYSAEPGEENDEARMLGRDAPGLIQVLDADRVRGGRRAVRELGADCLVLDDGYQRLGLVRSLNIVLLDALCPFGGGWLFPAGALREPASGVSRADVVVITRAGVASADALGRLVSRARRLAPRAAIVRARFEPQALEALGDGDSPPLEALRGERLFAFCGLGAPAGFFGTLGRLWPASVRGVALEDHAAYPDARLALLAGEAVKEGAEYVVTTCKDAVKIGARWPGPTPAFALRTRVEFPEGGELLRSRLLRAVGGPEGG